MWEDCISEKSIQRKTNKVVFQKTLNNQDSTDLESLGVSAQVSGPLEGSDSEVRTCFQALGEIYKGKVIHSQVIERVALVKVTEVR